MQINHTRIALKGNKLNVTSFSIARIASSILAKIAILKNPKNKQSNNKEPRLNPVCWQCGSERALLTVHTAQGVHFVCHTCGGEQ